MSTDITNDEPSISACWHAMHMESLYAEYRAAAKALADVCQKLIDHDAAHPVLTTRHKPFEIGGKRIVFPPETPVTPCEGMDWLDSIAEADFSDCYEQNAAEFDRVSVSNARERGAGT